MIRNIHNLEKTIKVSGDSNFELKTQLSNSKKMLEKVMLQLAEVKKAVRFNLTNAHGADRAFYVEVLRFLDQYFRA